jgi:hypothetical protein
MSKVIKRNGAFEFSPDAKEKDLNSAKASLKADLAALSSPLPEDQIRLILARVIVILLASSDL